MNETSLNAECGIDGLSVLAHDLAYWDHFSLQVALKKHIFFKKLGLTPCKAEQLLQGMELQKKKHKKIKAYRKSL